ncbi:MAG: glycerophosphodiester phosphodiesterase family protein [Bacteroidota bacterium]
MKNWYLIAIVVLLGACSSTKNGKLSSVNRIDFLLSEMKNPDSDYVMVVAHRADWRHAPENSLQAIQGSIDMGVDMIEIDVRRTKDGELVLMHDETIDRTTNGKGRVEDYTLAQLRELRLINGIGRWTEHTIPTLEEAMLLAKGKILVNLDKCYDYFPEAFEVLKATNTIDHAVMKGKHPLQKVKSDFGEYLDKVFFMPIIDLDKEDAEEIIKEYQAELKPVAFELIFKTEQSDLLNRMKEIRDRGSKIWINSLWASLNAGHDDDLAVKDPENSYGWLLAKEATMIQTDRPQLLIDYLQRSNRR